MLIWYVFYVKYINLSLFKLELHSLISLQILAEFLELKKIEDKIFFEEIDKLIKKLVKYYRTKKEVHARMNCLQHLCLDLKNKTKNFPTLFTVNEVRNFFSVLLKLI